MKRQAVCLALAALTLASSASPMTTAQRREYLNKLLQILPDVPSFDEWLKKTGELPPDFDALPRSNELPDPFRFLNGSTVRTEAQWPARRAEIKTQFEKYVIGRVPAVPKLDRAVVLDETPGNGYVVRNLRLEFGPQSKGTVRIQIAIPEGKGPFPALITTNLNGWAPQLLRRGYISCGYAGNDAMDDGAALAQLYPEYDFALLPRRGWLASVVVDYLESLPEVDKRRIGIFGYSRDGKTVTIAAALDERITAVIAGSTGVGGILPWRLGSERNSGESIESTTLMFPTWFAPQLRFFSGREDRLPVDGNLLVAMIAPRPVLMEYGLNDEVSNSWGSEQTYHSALKVYKLLGRPTGLNIFRLPGFHGANDSEADLDWLDIQFGRSSRVWDDNFLFPWSFDKWRANAKETVDLSRYPAQHSTNLLAGTEGSTISSVGAWETRADSIRKSIHWILGDEPPLMPAAPSRLRPGARPGPRPGGNPGQTTPDLVAWAIQRGGLEFGWLEPEKDQTTSRSINFGYGVKGDLYYPTNTPPNAKLPTVIWLHGYSYPLGYMWVYRRDLHPILALVRAGYAVLAYDQSGFGSRMNEAGPFYDRYPHWSQMGRMVEDVHTAIDALQKESLVDPQRIYLFGYSMGGMVGLYSAAFDSRVKGVVSICGFTPMRTDTAEKGTGGIARYSYEHELLPRLGFFVGHEAQLPYDFDEVLGMLAPRPVLVVQPQLDRDATPADVHRAVEAARQVYAIYNASGKLELKEPWDYNRLPDAIQNDIIKWMGSNFQ
ncbi:MAG TPA: alpha/beta fold hydrolase [Bryobacteraceae bacterium]|nr:alpha/beta fold hydrolase [Bryobacteraceae bacterium]